MPDTWNFHYKINSYMTCINLEKHMNNLEWNSDKISYNIHDNAISHLMEDG